MFLVSVFVHVIGFNLMADEKPRGRAWQCHAVISKDPQINVVLNTEKGDDFPVVSSIRYWKNEYPFNGSWFKRSTSFEQQKDIVFHNQEVNGIGYYVYSTQGKMQRREYGVTTGEWSTAFALKVTSTPGKENMYFGLIQYQDMNKSKVEENLDCHIWE